MQVDIIPKRATRTDVACLIPVAQQVIGICGMAFHTIQTVIIVSQRSFNNFIFKICKRQPEKCTSFKLYAKEKLEFHKKKFFINLIRFIPGIGTLFSLGVIALVGRFKFNPES